MKLEDITVIVPTKNEAVNIPFFLRAIHPDLKLIVVDASNDRTREIITIERPKNTTIVRSQAHISIARHLGAKISRTPWLLFTDADICFHPLFFQHLSTIEGFDGCYGPKLSITDFIEYYESFSSWQRLFHKLGIPAASGSNFLVRRQAYFQAGGFDPDLRVNEDTELSWRLKRYGFIVNYDSELIVYARDHRRLMKGVTRKNLHSLTRCALLYFNLMPRKWRTGDWGYWSSS